MLFDDARFQAFDIDLPPNNNNITYSIIGGNDLGNFTINPSTGEVGLAAPLDYEAIPASMAGRFELTVMAQDRGVPALSSTADVIINVEDLNDESPYFQPELYTASIPENSTGGMRKQRGKYCR